MQKIEQKTGLVTAYDTKTGTGIVDVCGKNESFSVLCFHPRKIQRHARLGEYVKVVYVDDELLSVRGD